MSTESWTSFPLRLNRRLEVLSKRVLNSWKQLEELGAGEIVSISVGGLRSTLAWLKVCGAERCGTLQHPSSQHL